VHSAIQVVERTSLRLVILDPPYALAGVVVIVAAIAIAVGLWFVKLEGDPSGRIGWAALIFAAPFALIGWLLLTNETIATLSRETNTFTIEKRYFGMFSRTRQYPLAQLEGAVVGSDQNTAGLSFSLVSGEAISLGSFTDRKGYANAANAVNEFLLESPR
jgi:hypothetical protein